MHQGSTQPLLLWGSFGGRVGTSRKATMQTCPGLDVCPKCNTECISPPTSPYFSTQLNWVKPASNGVDVAMCFAGNVRSCKKLSQLQAPRNQASTSRGIFRIIFLTLATDWNHTFLSAPMRIRGSQQVGELPSASQDELLMRGTPPNP